MTGRAVEEPRYTTDRIDTDAPVRETVSIGARRTVVEVGKTQLDVSVAGIARRVFRSIETTPARPPVATSSCRVESQRHAGSKCQRWLNVRVRLVLARSSTTRSGRLRSTRMLRVLVMYVVTSRRVYVSTYVLWLDRTSEVAPELSSPLAASTLCAAFVLYHRPYTEFGSK